MACGCSDSSCTCLVQGNGTTTVSGAGTVANPYIVSSSAGPTFAANNPGGGLTITPGGTQGHSPSIDLDIDPASPAEITIGPDGLSVECCSAAAGDAVLDSERYRLENTTPFTTAQTFPLVDGLGSDTMGSMQVYFSQIVVPENIASAVGLGFVLTAQGTYTPVVNKIGLFSSDGTTLTLFASSPNVPNLWQPGSTGGKQQAFTTPIAVPAGIYYVAFLKYSSGSPSDPELLIKSHLVTSVNKIYGSASLLSGNLGAQTDLPASTAISAISANPYYRWAAIY